MCGIFGYAGKSDDSVNIFFKGLKRLEYRGYDSWGIASANNNKIHLIKKTGPIANLKSVGKFAQSYVAIGHTRWATHGKVTVTNAHPHYSTDNSFVVAHNGIVENFEDLKSSLKRKGFKFGTETDTEVIVRLIEGELSKKNDVISAIFGVIDKIEGRNTFIVLTDDGQIIAARNGSPLVIGIDNDSYYFSSDSLSFSNEAKRMLFVDNKQVVIYDGKLKLFDAKSRKELIIKTEKVKVHSNKVDKEGYEHFMLKEIYEIPYVLGQLVKQDRKVLEKLAQAVRKANNVYTVGSGTTGLAAAQIAYFLRANANINVASLVGADSQEYYKLFTKKDLIIAPSQSGETADVLEVLENAHQIGTKIATNVNMTGSMMTKLSDFKFQTMAGPEICVVSTKVFIAHIAWGYLLSMTVSKNYELGIKNLQKLAKEIEKYLNDQNNIIEIRKIAKKLIKKDHIFLLGKAQNFQAIREGMIKLIETSYIHAMPAGDLKHYAITLMEKGVPVIVAVSEDAVKNDVLNAVSEVKARGVDVIGLASEDHKDFDYLLKVPEMGDLASIMNVVTLQLLAYNCAIQLGHNVDRPRNIAKSVTVK